MGSKGGGIRGFMNDGSLDYKSYHSVDSLAFGHCDYSYRNLGRPSKLQIRQEGNIFEVMIDDRMCISTDKVGSPTGSCSRLATDRSEQIRMPPEYHFGITAASAETPDSFEAYKFKLLTSRSITREEPRRAQQPYAEQPHINVNTPPETPASAIDQSKQFEDLHNRLQIVTHLVDVILNEVKVLADKSDGRHQELSRNAMSADRLNAMDQRIQGIEKTVRDYQGQFSSLQAILKDSHSSLAESLPNIWVTVRIHFYSSYPFLVLQVFNIVFTKSFLSRSITSSLCI